MKNLLTTILTIMLLTNSTVYAYTESDISFAGRLFQICANPSSNSQNTCDIYLQGYLDGLSGAYLININNEYLSLKFLKLTFNKKLREHPELVNNHSAVVLSLILKDYNKASDRGLDCK